MNLGPVHIVHDHLDPLSQVPPGQFEDFDRPLIHMQDTKRGARDTRLSIVGLNVVCKPQTVSLRSESPSRPTSGVIYSSGIGSHREVESMLRVVIVGRNGARNAGKQWDWRVVSVGKRAGARQYLLVFTKSVCMCEWKIGGPGECKLLLNYTKLGSVRTRRNEPPRALDFNPPPRAKRSACIQRASPDSVCIGRA